MSRGDSMFFDVFNKKIISQRLRALRLSHRLSGACLAELLQFKSQGAVSNMENGKAMPLFESAGRISNLFAISLNWLTGQTDSIYDEQIIESLEQKLIKQAKTLEREEKFDGPLRYFRLEMYFLFSPTFQYVDKTFRSKCSLAVRANMIFIMQIFHHISLKFYEVYKTPKEEMNKFTVNTILIPKFKKTKNGIAFLELSNMCKDVFYGYMSEHIDLKTPIFDVAETLKQMTKDRAEED